MMAPVAGPVARPAAARGSPLRPERIDHVLSVGAVLLFAFAVAAIVRGHDQWTMVPPLIWLHLSTILVATALTPVMLLRARGNHRHRVTGKLWIVAMLATAISSLFIHVSGAGRFSVIHILSVWTLVQVPLIWWTARRHNVVRHRRAVHGMVIGALLVAGFFTFPFDRLLGTWLFG